MSHCRVMRAATLMLGMLAVAHLAGAAPRGADVRRQAAYEVDDAVGDPAAWTKRLVGRFRLDGVIHHESEILGLDGSFTESSEEFTALSWLRLPCGARLRAKAGTAGARVWIKDGHLAHVMAQLERLPGSRLLP